MRPLPQPYATLATMLKTPLETYTAANKPYRVAKSAFSFFLGQANGRRCG